MASHSSPTLENVTRLSGMEEASREVTPTRSAQQKEDFLHQSMMPRLMSFCLVFLRLGHILEQFIIMDNGLGLMDLPGTLRFGEAVTPKPPQY